MAFVTACLNISHDQVNRLSAREVHNFFHYSYCVTTDCHYEAATSKALLQNTKLVAPTLVTPMYNPLV